MDRFFRSCAGSLFMFREEWRFFLKDVHDG